MALLLLAAELPVVDHRLLYVGYALLIVVFLLFFRLFPQDHLRGSDSIKVHLMVLGFQLDPPRHEELHQVIIHDVVRYRIFLFIDLR